MMPRHRSATLEFDLDHCRITAPFTGRIGTHLVSVGNLIAGSRYATSPTTLLATLVSLDPIYFDFDMSESDFLTFSRDRARQKGTLADKVELALSDETKFTRRGTLDFVDNVLDRSSGTIHARATVPNPELFLTPGEFARVRLVARRRSSDSAGAGCGGPSRSVPAPRHDRFSGWHRRAQASRDRRHPRRLARHPVRPDAK